MEAIEAVLDLAKERDEIARDLEMYDEWFQSLVGRQATVTIKNKKKTRFVDCTVTHFVRGEGWELTSDEDENEMFTATFSDLFDGTVFIHETV